MICLDTSFILDLFKKRQSSVDKFKLLATEEIVSTEINYFEILYGIFKKHDFNQKELNLVQNFFDSIRVFSLEGSSAYKSAEIAGELAKKGQTIEVNDILIAGICLANNCTTIITKDINHFSRVKGLKVETY